MTATLLWWAVDPSSLLEVLQEPLAGTMILLGVLFGILAQLSLRAPSMVPAYGKALNQTILLGVAGGCATASLKFSMNHTPDLLSVFIWSFLLNIVIAIAGLIRFVVDQRAGNVDHNFFHVKAIKGGLVLGAVVAVAGPIVTFSFAKAPNPGFSSIVTRFSDVWLFFYCILLRKPTNVTFAGLALTFFGAICLILGTEILK